MSGSSIKKTIHSEEYLLSDFQWKPELLRKFSHITLTYCSEKCIEPEVDRARSNDRTPQKFGDNADRSFFQSNWGNTVSEVSVRSINSATAFSGGI